MTTTTTTTETTDAVKPVRNFRNSPDIENFYRFIHENDLRREAKMIFEAINAKVNKSAKKKSRAKKVQ